MEDRNGKTIKQGDRVVGRISPKHPEITGIVAGLSPSGLLQVYEYGTWAQRGLFLDSVAVRRFPSTKRHDWAEFQERAMERITREGWTLEGKPRASGNDWETLDQEAAQAPVARNGQIRTPCLCGCGEFSRGAFRPGHDARLSGWMKKTIAGKEIGAEERSRMLLAIESGHEAMRSPYMEGLAIQVRAQAS